MKGNGVVFALLILSVILIGLLGVFDEIFNWF